MDIFVNQKLSVHEEMAIFGQFTESRIKVIVSDADGEGKEVGVVEKFCPKHDGYRVKLHLDGKRVNRRTNGFVFTNIYGTWFLTRPD